MEGTSWPAGGGASAKAQVSWLPPKWHRTMVTSAHKSLQFGQELVGSAHLLPLNVSCVVQNLAPKITRNELAHL